jgi:hypothetical protein
VRGKACSRSLETRKEGGTDEDGSLGYCPSSSDQLARLDLRSVVRAADHPTRIGRRLADLQWVVTGYALMFGILLLLSGRAGDQLGGGDYLCWAYCSLAWLSPRSCRLSHAWRRGRRALVSPSALSLLTTCNPEGAARNRALSCGRPAHPPARPHG